MSYMKTLIFWQYQLFSSECGQKVSSTSQYGMVTYAIDEPMRKFDHVLQLLSLYVLED